RRQFILGFRLRFARDRAKKSAGRFLQCFDCAVGQRVAFLAPKFPADVARHVFGIEFHPIQHEPRRFHHIVSDAVPRHPSNSIFRHKMSILSACPRLASESENFTADYADGADKTNRRKRRWNAISERVGIHRPRRGRSTYFLSREATRFSAPPETINS